MSKSASNLNQISDKETIKKLLTAPSAPPTNNNISKSSELQKYFSEALVETIAAINQTKDLKQREKELTELSNNAASLVGQPKNYMKILVNDAARKMAKEHTLQLLKDRIPALTDHTAKLIRNEILSLDAEGPTAKQRARAISKLAKHAAAVWVGWDEKTKLSGTEIGFLSNIYDTQQIQDSKQRDESMKNLQESANKDNTNAKPKEPKIDLEKLKKHLENITNAITGVANIPPELPKKGILSKITNEIKLMIAQTNVVARGKGNQAGQIGQLITTATKEWTKKIRDEKGPKNQQSR